MKEVEWEWRSYLCFNICLGATFRPLLRRWPLFCCVIFHRKHFRNSVIVGVIRSEFTNQQDRVWHWDAYKSLDLLSPDRGLCFTFRDFCPISHSGSRVLSCNDVLFGPPRYSIAQWKLSYTLITGVWHHLCVERISRLGLGHQPESWWLQNGPGPFNIASSYWPHRSWWLSF